MHTAAVELEGKLRARNQLQTAAGGACDGGIDTLKGVMIRQGKCTQPSVDGQTHQLSRVDRSVGRRRVGVQINGQLAPCARYCPMGGSRIGYVDADCLDVHRFERKALLN